MAGSNRTLWRYLIRLPLYLLVFWVLGFGLYVMRLPHVDPDPIPHADAIIVLTGGAGRLEAGMDLLAKKSAKRLFISGVHPSVVRSELSKLTGADPALFECCVDLGRIALNTYGNATESRAWVEAHGFHKLILVTADYHMPRSLLLFRHVIPEAEVIAFPVNTGRPLHLLVKEYTKYLFTVVGQLLPDRVYEHTS